ncbi:DUF3793 family protein [Clostridium sp. KNHs214]|uniref:DUF3793 family protein n=1 Tax=Clostridium sp. KNHs214 TaxID=1540257 RepID=UPI00055417EE|nr:DUF3793 family protein [Clostridium sp. KNHs214]
MSELESKKYIKIMNNVNELEYLLFTIVYNASPAIAGEKASSLLVFRNNGKNLYKLWLENKEEIQNNLKLRYFTLKNTHDTCVVLFYNEDMLNKILQERKTQRFLKRFNYSNFNSTLSCLRLLKERYEYACPHEIGIFLGYPLEDVVDFIECPNKQCLLRGYWKVYNNEEFAKDRFYIYDSIKSKVLNLLYKGENPKSILMGKI